MTPARNTGSSILNAWRAEREAAGAGENQAARTIPVSEIVPGSEGYSWLVDAAPGRRAVSEHTAMAVGAVYACVALIGGALGQLVLQTYSVGSGGTTKVMSDLWYMLNKEMHPRWAAAVGWEFLAQALLLQGDGHIRIHRPTPFSSAVESLEPMHPRSVSPMLVDDRLVYTIVNLDGTVETVDQDDMIHVPGPGFDGLRGISQLRHVLRQPVSKSLATGDLDESLVHDGLRPDLALQTEAKLAPDQIDSLRSQWRERYGGMKNQGAPIVLSSGMKIERITMTAADAQLLDSKKLTVEDIARIFGVPPFMIGQVEKQTSWGSGIEQMGTGFVRYTLGRHMTKIEQELERKLARRGQTTIAYDAAALQRGDTKSRYDAYRAALGGAGMPGWMSKNEVRAQENLPPKEGGDQLFDGQGNGKPTPPAAE